MSLSISSTELFVIGFLFIAYYEVFFKLPLILKSLTESESVEVVLLNKLVFGFVSFVSLILDTIPFLVSFIFPPAAIALYGVAVLRMWIKEPNSRVFNMTHTVMVNFPLFIHSYLLFS